LGVQGELGTIVEDDGALLFLGRRDVDDFALATRIYFKWRDVSHLAVWALRWPLTESATETAEPRTEACAREANGARAQHILELAFQKSSGEMARTRQEQKKTEDV
jgi:hypothetical protein